MEGMMSKWQIGPVKLTNGEEAYIDAINEGQEDWRYTGRILYAPGLWIAAGWHASGRYMYAHTDYGLNLAPPPKKTVRVQAWLMVWPTGAVTVFYREDEAVFNARKHGFALLPIDREVTEGEGLS
jgi:hypothetical protein